MLKLALALLLHMFPVPPTVDNIVVTRDDITKACVVYCNKRKEGPSDKDEGHPINMDNPSTAVQSD